MKKKKDDIVFLILKREMDYKKFKSGLSFKAVRRELSTEQEIAKKRGEYMFVTRHTVLGRMHEYKQVVFRSEYARRYHELVVSDINVLLKILNQLGP